MSRKQAARPHPNAPLVAFLLIALAVAMAVGATAAKAGQYKAVLCAANNGSNAFGTSTNTASAQNPGGIFNFENYCGATPNDPAGDAAFLRISENQAGGNAGQGAYGNIYWDTPSWVHFKAGGGYTRQLYAFNDGWRARFWVASASSSAQIMTQGAGLPNSGGQWGSSNIFGPHLWPLSVYYDFTRFVYEMQCVRPAGCDRVNFNSTDANSFVFILEDDWNSQVRMTDGSPMMTGQWVRGTQTATFSWAEYGSGIRFERLRVDGGDRWVGDWNPNCNRSTSQTNGEFARVFQPCPVSANVDRALPLDTATLGDGPHTLQACTQDYGQWQGLNGTRSESCDQRTIRVDNTAPGAPPGLQVTSANPERYLDTFDAHWSLPPNEGSPIEKVHYDIVNAAGEIVVPEKVVTGTNLTQTSGIQGRAQPDAYQLRVWLEDAVGLVGPKSIAPIPHDTTPPAAPQDISVTAPGTTRAADGFDLRWRNVPDAGSPIAAAHYEVINDSGGVVVPTQTLGGANIQQVERLESPRDRGPFGLRLWLSDAEGNVGAPVTVPLSYDCVRSDVSGGTELTSGLGKGADATEIVEQGGGSLLKGKLSAANGKVGGAPLCVFSRVITDRGRDFLGLAITDADGSYRFAVPAGASRELTVEYRSEHRELSDQSTIETIVEPTFTLVKKVIRNKRFARFKAHIPGPHNDNVVVVLQVKRGKGWLAFRRYRTRANGWLKVGYRMTRTTQPTKYLMRAQVRETVGYPYREGDSKPQWLIVLPRGKGG